MAKRPRGSRPGQRRPTTRSAATRPTSRPPQVELDAGAVEPVPAGGSPTRSAPDEPSGRTGRPGSGTSAGRGRPASTLAAQTADEYLYVTQDIRRIVVVAGSLLILMLILFVLIEVVGIFGS